MFCFYYIHEKLFLGGILYAEYYCLYFHETRKSIIYGMDREKAMKKERLIDSIYKLLLTRELRKSSTWKMLSKSFGKFRVLLSWQPRENFPHFLSIFSLHNELNRLQWTWKKVRHSSEPFCMCQRRILIKLTRKFLS